MKSYEFTFGIGDSVRIKASGETGVVRGVSRTSGSEQIQVHYKAGDGRAVTDWWDAELIETA